MTKKDYELFANEVHKQWQYSQDAEWPMSLTSFLSRVFAMDNSSFNAEKFKIACYEGKHIRKSIKGGK